MSEPRLLAYTATKPAKTPQIPVATRDTSR